MDNRIGQGDLMPLTARSHIVHQLLPSLRAGVRAARLQATHADDALQQSLVALIPHLERLSAMPERESTAYAYVVASRTAMALRKRIGLQNARGTDEEVQAWDRAIARRSVTPEQVMQAAEGAEKAKQVFGEFTTQDRRIMEAVGEGDFSEREAAQAFGISRGNVAYRLRRAREALARAWFGTTSWMKGKRPGA
ncbi:sigma-70 family RNA polymerase sigma factor [Pendulispora albinea]|uniref:Sigma-70 family RNA polymerase sigma factor n=1 Tax=Pendulispora albinea TaxID=2741071 RepID=A0ABZ2LZX2_9BACT